jgi:hypothetical protein
VGYSIFAKVLLEVAFFFFFQKLHCLQPWKQNSCIYILQICQAISKNSMTPFRVFGNMDYYQCEYCCQHARDDHEIF